MAGVKINDLPNKIKDRILPPVGSRCNIGEFFYEVTHRNVGKARFTLTLVGRAEQSRIVNPQGQKMMIMPGEGK